MEKVPYIQQVHKGVSFRGGMACYRGGLSAGEAAMRLSLPKSTLENWLRDYKAGKLEGTGKGHRPLTDVEVELAWVKRELALMRMERDVLKKTAAYFSVLPIARS